MNRTRDFDELLEILARFSFSANVLLRWILLYSVTASVTYNVVTLLVQTLWAELHATSNIAREDVAPLVQHSIPDFLD